MPRPPLGLAVPLWLVILVACSSAAFAGQENPTAAALAELRQAADQGNADAQFNLGVMYANGQGVPQDDAQAVAWTRRAADQGYARPDESSSTAATPNVPLASWP